MTEQVPTAPFADLTAQVAAVQEGRISASELLAASQARADALDARLGTYLQRFDAAAQAAAKAVDVARARGPLAGVPLGIKAMIACREGHTTAQSRVCDPSFYKGRDAPVIARLRAAGAIITGATSMAEHAAGRCDPQTPFPMPRSPWDLGRWPGGSSAGTANGIAAGLFEGGLGTDSSGSCRIPAAYCGITGLRPTHGWLPLHGVLPASHSVDVVGPMARSARDCALLLAVLAERPVVSAARLEGRRLGVPDAVLADPRIAEDTRTVFSRAMRTLEDAGVRRVAVTLPDLDALIQATLIVMVYEIHMVHAQALRTRWADYGRSFRRIAAAGAALDTADQARALRVADRLGLQLEDVLATVDAIALPTWPCAAPRFLASGGMPQDDFNLTAAFSVSGQPALALPMGFDAAGMPLSLQLVGARHRDEQLLQLGMAYQQLSDWHLQRPRVPLHGKLPPVPDLDAGATPAGESAPPWLERAGIPADGLDLATTVPLAHKLKAAAAALPD